MEIKDISKFRIGNLVCTKMELTDNGVHELYQDITEQMMNDSKIMKRPIILNDYIFSIFGFSDDFVDRYCSRHDEMEPCVVYSLEDFEIVDNGGFKHLQSGKTIDFCHELQNLYSEIKGKELKIINNTKK